MSRHATLSWSLYGALFGVCFPIMALGLRAYSGGTAGAVAALQSDPLIWIILTAPAFLGLFAALGGRKQDEVARLNRNLERKVEARTLDLASALSDVQLARKAETALLNALEAGLVSFDANGQLSTARSAALARLLPDSGSVETIEDLLEKYANIDAATTEMVRALLWDDTFWSPFEASVEMLQKRFTVDDRILESRFQPVYDAEDRLDRVLLQVFDRTRVVRAEQEQATTAARMERLALAARSRNAFLRFRREAEGLLDDMGASATPEHKRILHTLKGITRIFGFHDVAREVHALEAAVGDGGTASLAVVRAIYSDQADDVSSVLGLTDETHRLSIQREAFRDVLQRVDAHTAAALRALTASPAEDGLRHHGEAAERLAGHKNRRVVVSVDGADLYEDELVTFDEALTHILTNAVTHAAEEDRTLQIRVHVARTDRLRIRVHDDGPGIDRDRLAEKAVERGIWTANDVVFATDDELLELVFASGLSTRDEVSDTAGRGVGLAAARQSLRGPGGDLRVVAPEGQGTTFILEGPVEALQATG